MPASKAISTYNTGYFIHDGSEDPEAFVEVAEVMSIDAPDQQADDVEVTHFKSPDRAKEYIAGMIENGEAAFGINWIPSDDTDVRIRALKLSGDVRDQRIIWPNGVEWTFSGYIKGFKPDTPLGDRLTANVTVKVTGSTSIT